MPLLAQIQLKSPQFSPKEIDLNLNKKLSQDFEVVQQGNPNWRGPIGTVDLLVLTSSYQMLIILKIYILLFDKTSCRDEEVNRT